MSAEQAPSPDAEHTIAPVISPVERVVDQFDEHIQREQEDIVIRTVADTPIAPGDHEKPQKKVIIAPIVQAPAVDTQASSVVLTETYPVQDITTSEAPAIVSSVEVVGHDDAVERDSAVGGVDDKRPVVAEVGIVDVEETEIDFDGGFVETLGDTHEFALPTEQPLDVLSGEIDDLSDESFADDYVEEAETGALEYEGSPEEQVAVPLVLIELFAELEAREDDKISQTIEQEDEAELVDGATIALAETEPFPDSTVFVERLVEEIRSMPENPVLQAEEQPVVIAEEVIDVALKLQELKVNAPDVLSEEVKQEIEVIEEELRVVCEKLLKSMGIEADEKIITLMVQKIITSDLQQIKNQQLSVRELAHQGTHEYKHNDWFKKFLDSTSPLSHLVGRFVLQKAVTPL